LNGIASKKIGAPPEAVHQLGETEGKRNEA